ncbi:AAA family ATPase [Alicyclobacillus sp. SO9]|uniref:AAA family ATPase n=1 Tax=Alicyclobacillus sp. SO9 TaxID=2665646 RepID=UPI0018E7E2CC|nr:AAA family ATPase [Alicyclobacillus sp. SO9]QQE79148.1 AAA family ATPase [Alicyclobacillus sp. SO9]
MFLRELRFLDFPNSNHHPFDIPAFCDTGELNLNQFLTFFVGENGSGKSTLLEAIAIQAGFNPEGGSRSNQFATAATESRLFEYLKLRWLPKVTQGFFFRAESFFNFASYIDDLAKESFAGDPYSAYGGRSLHHQSHGESFLNLFVSRLSSRKPALYMLDEPEAALSPARQLALLRVLHDHQETGHSQFIVSTHSPILLGYPGATLLNFDGGSIEPILYEETNHYIITQQFLNARDIMLRELFHED